MRTTTQRRASGSASIGKYTPANSIIGTTPKRCHASRCAGVRWRAAQAVTPVATAIPPRTLIGTSSAAGAGRAAPRATTTAATRATVTATRIAIHVR